MPIPEMTSRLPSRNEYGSIETTHPSSVKQELDPLETDVETGLSRWGKSLPIALLLVCMAAFMVFLHGQGAVDVSRAKVMVWETEQQGPSCKECYDPPHYYNQQQVDHFDGENKETWTQRYYISEKHFGGPGHPIIMVIGGEGEAFGLYYPYVQDYLAKEFKAFVLQPELRFYGKSQPIKVKKNSDLVGLLTTEQAMEDFLQLLEHTQKKLGCSLDHSSKHYCPVITVGGSYPGFISAMLRFVHPEKVDIGYAASAPLHLHSQQVNSNDYFELVTRTAEQVSPGCPKAIEETLVEVHQSILESPSYLEAAKKMNICLDSIPDYIDSHAVFAEEVMMIVGENFADFNMDFYPPTIDTSLGQACLVFQNQETDIFGKMDDILQLIDDSNGYERPSCGFDMSTQVPDGTNATISTADWTGVGDGSDALSWEFQCCTELIVQTGFSDESMFYPRKWSLDWVTQHCQSRYGVDPTPTYLVDTFKFEDLSEASRLLFTNGLNDGWSASSILGTDNPNVVVLNFPNGAHHSDLRGHGPSDKDTDDIKLSHVQIMNQLELWLDEIEIERKQMGKKHGK